MDPARSGKLVAGAIAIVFACLCATALGASHPSQALVVPAVKSVDPSAYVAHPLAVAPAAVAPVTPATGPCPFAAQGYTCFGPAEIRRIYDVPSGYDGSGQTIIILVAYGNAAVQQDLSKFDQTFGLPDPPLHIVGPNGKGNPSDPSVAGWALEASFGVEWAHAIAP